MKTKKQKGITLIALIITIIVMLILVGVSVSVALNTGLFKTAQGAAKNTEAEKLKEQELSSGTIITETLEEVGAIKPNIGQIADLSKGDIVYYDEDKSGTNDEDEKYVVLYNDDTYGCQIISINLKGNVTLGASQSAFGDAVTPELREEAKAAYNNLVEILNTEASKYLNRTYGAYARSLGCNPMYGTMPLQQALNLYDTKEYESVETLLENAGEASFLYEEGGVAEGFLEGIKKSDEDYKTDYDAIYTSNATVREEIKKNFNGTYDSYFENDVYMLASRYMGDMTTEFLGWYVHAGSHGSWLFNGTFYALQDLPGDENWTFSVWGDCVSSIDMPIRSVITLKAECTVNTGAGNIDDPYTLSI